MCGLFSLVRVVRRYGKSSNNKKAPSGGFCVWALGKQTMLRGLNLTTDSTLFLVQKSP